MKRIVSRLIPISVKEAIKRSSHYELWSARRLATASKRIDICASQIAHLLHLSSHGPVQDIAYMALPRTSLMQTLKGSFRNPFYK